MAVIKGHNVNSTRDNKENNKENSSNSLDWRKRDGTRKSNFGSFSSARNRDARVSSKVNVLTPHKLATASRTKYVPPHMRIKEPRASKVDADATLRAKTPSPKNNKQRKQPKGPQTHLNTRGPLYHNAVDIFERAHGLHGRKQVDYVSLQREVMGKYGCSERAFESLVLGHSYDELLSSLRARVDGYLSKEERKRQRKERLKQKKAKSCNSSPTILSPLASPASHTTFLELPQSNTPEITSSPSRRRLFSEPNVEREQVSPKSVLFPSPSTDIVPCNSKAKVLTCYASSDMSNSDNAMCKTCNAPSTSQTALLTAAAIPLLFAAINSL